MQGWYSLEDSSGSRIDFNSLGDGNHSSLEIKRGTTCIRLMLDNQQLGELGALLLYLSSNSGGLDGDSVDSLLDGYGASVSSMQMLRATLDELSADLEDCTQVGYRDDKQPNIRSVAADGSTSGGPYV